jgi:Fe-S-cluster containining protein
MEVFTLDLNKHNLSHLKEKEIQDYSDQDIENLLQAYSKEIIAPTVPGYEFNFETVKYLQSQSKCFRCGRCCRYNSKTPENPGVMVSEEELRIISKNTKHKLKSLKQMTRINSNAVYEVGARYIPLTCVFYNETAKSCKIYNARPLICSFYPVSTSPNSKWVTIDVQCDYGKDIFRKALKFLRES